MLELFADSRGILLRRDAVAVGIDDNALRRAVDAGLIVRLRQGAYALRPIWEACDRVERYRLLVAAVRQQYGDGVALSHTSANVEQGGPTWGLELDDVHLTNLFQIGERRSARIVHHRGVCRVGDVTRDEDGWLTSPARTALDTATLASRDGAVAVLDYYQQQGLVTREELDVVFTAMKAWRDTLALHRFLQLSDGIAESVGETRTRLLCRDQHLPPPTPQLEIYAPGGFLIGRVDFAWPDRRTMLEFDGRQKYVKYRRPGESIEDAVLREKQREDRLREATGWIMVRITWDDLGRPVETARRILRAFEIAAA